MMATVGGAAQAQHTVGDHVCWVVDGDETKRGAVVAFLRDGLERGERLLYVAPRPLDDLLGLGDVDGMLADGRLRVESLTTVFGGLVAGGHVDPVTQVDRLRELTHEALVD